VQRDKGQLAKLINALKAKGYLIAKTDDIDKRQIRLELSKAGAEVQRQLRARTQQLADKACLGLSAKHRQDLMDSIEHMTKNLKNAP
jgi:DNA-binding MarR family transcriptional regulator